MSLHSRASALLIVLAIVTLVTVLVVSLLVLARHERSVAGQALSRQKCSLLADYAADTALGRLREAIDEGRRSGFAWSSLPGRIALFNALSPNSPTYREMFSGRPGSDQLNANCDLNKSSAKGHHPITGSVDATMKVGWTYLPADPSTGISPANPAAVRIAYWVDDDSCKVNLNTADGSAKNDPIATQIANGHFRYGFGVPSEISLQAFPGINKTTAANIADYAADKGFNSAAEIGLIPGVPTGFFADYQFDLTFENQTPEITHYGEPRINLMATTRLFNGTRETRAAALGGYSDYDAMYLSGGIATTANDSFVRAVSESIDFIYPTSAQLPQALAQYPNSQSWSSAFALTHQRSLSNNQALLDPANMAYLTRIANAINGRKNDGTSFQWPAFNGVTTGFSVKYSPRQIDSLTVQIFDLTHTTPFADQYKLYSLPTLALDGIINPTVSPTTSRSVVGLSRGAKLNEIFIESDANAGTINGADVMNLKLSIRKELYFPKHIEGVPLHTPYGGITRLKEKYLSADTEFDGFNLLDAPTGTTTSLYYTNASPLGGKWQNKLLRVVDQNGADAGVDLVNNSVQINDPDQALAAQFHPYRLNGTAYSGGRNELTPNKALARPMLGFGSPFPLATSPVNPGIYYSQLSAFGNYFSPSKPNVTQLKLEGGLTYWSRTGDSGQQLFSQWETVPLDSLHGLSYSTESAADILTNWRDAVIPMPADFQAGDSALLRVADPLVNRFPGDWDRLLNPAPTEITMSFSAAKGGSGYPNYYLKNGSAAFDSAFTNPASTFPPDAVNGDNPGYQPSGGGDPLSLWLPRQDIRYPKQSRFPSVGALNFIRTGMIPDDLTVPIKQQKGAPWRSLNFSMGTAPSQTVHASQYPDWAMLDLFTVPFLPQKPYRADLSESATPIRKLTRGGATAGKLNINNPKIPYPFSETIAGVDQNPPERTRPLEALFYGLRLSRAYDSSTGNPTYLTLDPTQAQTLATAVQGYLDSTGRPFLFPGELTNVPEIGGDARDGGFTYDEVAIAARSRNDLLREVVGATTTQSNTFSVWVVVQTFRKAKQNADYTQFQPGDMITGEVRRHYVIERMLETGIDGSPGNAKNPGTDLIIGTADDPIDALYHPAMNYPLPYRWRIVSARDV